MTDDTGQRTAETSRLRQDYGEPRKSEVSKSSMEQGERSRERKIVIQGVGALKRPAINDSRITFTASLLFSHWPFRAAMFLQTH